MDKEKLIRSQLEIAAAAIEAAFLMLENGQEEEEDGPCKHPEESRKDCSTSGINRYFCPVCQEIIEEGGG